ncbi:MAG: glycerophosphodiester phosphodiesterase [Bacteroidetes bacterium]|nr:glycerophosphodiester phosphodiesterase [Bacteroidota bacterium]
MIGLHKTPFKGLIAVLILLAGLSCSQKPPQSGGKVDWQGHRGARGLAPENTIPSFLKALDLGVNTLELDVVISADSVVMVSHEPWMNAAIASWPDGRPVSETDGPSLNLYRMTADSIQKFDVGRRGNPEFPGQVAMPAIKPSLYQVFAATEAYRVEKSLPKMLFNIEIKSTPEGDGVFHPHPDEFARLVVDQIRWTGFTDRVIIQSFDPRALVAVHRLTEQIPLALLVWEKKSVSDHLKSLPFIPDILSPHYKLVTHELISEAKKKGMKVIPWTVNEPADMTRLVAMGVDGIITDYPDRIPR